MIISDEDYNANDECSRRQDSGREESVLPSVGTAHGGIYSAREVASNSKEWVNIFTIL